MTFIRLREEAIFGHDAERYLQSAAMKENGLLSAGNLIIKTLAASDFEMPAASVPAVKTIGFAA